jgi:hypothetical protein
MLNPLSYYEKIKNEQHVFIYCVCGRSSSTAFQRIINSSNKVWIWGERHGLIDNIVSQINKMKNLQNDDYIKYSLTQMYDSYKTNKHLSFYPNAIGNLDSTVKILNSSISNMLKPWAIGLKRFGFKDIEITDIQTLTYLKDIFPQCFIVFCFRDPLKQWPSVNKLLKWWDYSKDLNLFLNEYYRISNIYLEFSFKNNINALIENEDLKQSDKIEKIIDYLNIPEIDNALLNVTVDSANGAALTEFEKEAILNSNAYRNYLTMKKISETFYQS